MNVLLQLYRNEFEKKIMYVSEDAENIRENFLNFDGMCESRGESNAILFLQRRCYGYIATFLIFVICYLVKNLLLGKKSVTWWKNLLLGKKSVTW